jgi:hypothetical protein
MSDLKPTGVAIEINGREERMLFTLNVMEKAVERYGQLEDLMQSLNKGLPEIKWFAAQMINECIDIWNDEHPEERRQSMTEQQLGHYIVGLTGINALSERVREAIFQGLPKDTVEMVEETAKNLLTMRETDTKTAAETDAAT